MGLDVFYYAQIVPVPSEEVPLDEYGEPTDDYRAFFRHPDFGDAPYEGLVEGQVYRTIKAGHFRAGSYSGYGDWRNWLARVAGYPVAFLVRHERRQYVQSAWDATSGPFWELLNFSDCEGTLGPVVSRKLAKDFADFQARADALAQNEWYREQYECWRAAFEVAAEHGGAVVFA